MSRTWGPIWAPRRARSPDEGSGGGSLLAAARRLGVGLGLAAGEVGLQPDRAVAALDQPRDHTHQAAELGGAQALELHVVDLALDRRKLGEPRVAGLRDLESNAPAVVRMRVLVNQAALKQLVRHRGDERAAEMQVLGDPVDADVTLLGGQMADRDQGRILDSHQPDARAVAGAHRLVTGEKPEQAVDQAAELAIGAVD